MNPPNQPPRGGPGQYPQQQYGPPPGGHQHWPPPAHPAVQPKKRRVWPWIVLGVVAFIVLASVFANNTSTPPVSNPGGSALPATAAPRASADTAAVTYEIIGSSKASNVTYNTDGGGSISQEANVKLPWRKEIAIERGLAVATLTAQNGDSGELTCRISVDGQVVKEAKSSGQFAVVSCASDPIT